MLGGLSNVLHKVQVRDVHVKSELASTGGPQSLLVRTFGANPTLVNRAKEQAIFDACDAAGVSPHMYALDTELGLRAEEFLEGSCMTIEQLRDEEYELRMCPLVAQLHTVEVPLPPYKEAWLPHKVKQWLRAAKEVGPQLGGSALAEYRELTTTVDLEAEVAWLCDVMLPGFEESMRGLGTPGVDNPVDVIFCHNDLQEGNWLVQSDKSLKAIDYEYGGYNYRCYDLANMFAECGYDYTLPGYPMFSRHPHLVPSKRQRQHVWQAYILACRVQHAVKHGANSVEAARATVLAGPDDDELVRAYLRASPVMAMGAHMIWSLWGVILAFDDPDIDFGYMQHSIARARDYKRIKDLIVSRD